MHIEPGSLIGVAVSNEWRQAALPFLKARDQSHADTERYFLFAALIELSDQGVWVKYQEKDGSPTYSMLIPWKHILTVVEAPEFPAELRHEARKIGFGG
jgi:hypothetical protein